MNLESTNDSSLYESITTDDYLTSFNINGDAFTDNDSYSDPTKNIQEKKAYLEIDSLISKKFPNLKKVNGTRKVKVKKEQFTPIFEYILLNISNYSIVEIWAYLASYLSIDESKFYDGLSQTYREQLFTFLLDHTTLINKEKLKNLF